MPLAGFAAPPYTCALAVRWAPFRHGGDLIATPTPALAQEHARLADAFRGLHGPSLHGFAMLVTLGDEPAAERTAGRALAAGAEQAAALVDPRREAAWLRARALRDLSGWQRRRSIPTLVRRDALASLGVDDSLYQALAAMPLRARAALVASTVERFAATDIETIMGAAPAASRRAVADARLRYLRAVGEEPGIRRVAPTSHPEGELAKRVQAVAARAMGTDGVLR